MWRHLPRRWPHLYAAVMFRLAKQLNRVSQVTLDWTALRLVGRISWKLKVRKSHAIDHNLIRSYSCWRFKTICAAIGHEIVLINAVSADAKPRDQHTIPE